MTNKRGTILSFLKEETKKTMPPGWDLTIQITGAGNGAYDGEEADNINWYDNETGAGKDFTGIYDAGLIFQNIPTLKGKIITSAMLYMRGKGTWYHNCGTKFRIKGIKEADTPAWATNNRPSQRAKTTAYSDWTLCVNWSNNVWKYSPEIKDIIQEIINQAGWANGNNIGVVVEDNGSGTQDAQVWYDFYNAPASCVYLCVNFETPASPDLTSRNNYNGYLAFVQQYIKHKINGTDPWKNPNGEIL